jgi:hypothetical protein
MDTDMLISLLFSGGAGLAGLILVFLGGTINAYESYSTLDKKAVRSKYRTRAWLGFAGFLFAILAALSALSMIWLRSNLLQYISIISILVSFGLAGLLAFLAVKEV